MLRHLELLDHIKANKSSSSSEEDDEFEKLLSQNQNPREQQQL
jgi:hypothetical protein